MPRSPGAASARCPVAERRPGTEPLPRQGAREPVSHAEEGREERPWPKVSRVPYVAHVSRVDVGLGPRLLWLSAQV